LAAEMKFLPQSDPLSKRPAITLPTCSQHLRLVRVLAIE
jgi:hypothetical protein